MALRDRRSVDDDDAPLLVRASDAPDPHRPEGRDRRRWPSPRPRRARVRDRAARVHRPLVPDARKACPPTSSLIAASIACRSIEPRATTASQGKLTGSRRLGQLELHVPQRPVALHAWLSERNTTARPSTKPFSVAATQHDTAIVGGIIGAGIGPDAIPDWLSGLRDWPRSTECCGNSQSPAETRLQQPCNPPHLCGGNCSPIYSSTPLCSRTASPATAPF